MIFFYFVLDKTQMFIHRPLAVAGIIPEVNLSNPLHAGHKACKWEIHPEFETQGRRHQGCVYFAEILQNCVVLRYLGECAR